MQELIIQFDVGHPVELLGAGNANLKAIRKHFPRLKLIARGDTLKVLGQTADIEKFDAFWADCIKHFDQYNSLVIKDVENMLLMDSNAPALDDTDKHIILFGNKGKIIKARTANQRKMIREMKTNDIMFAVGPAGTGKTYTAVALAVKALKIKEVQRIVLTRPAVEAGESLGFLPGDLKEKLDPYLRPLYDALMDMIPHDKLAQYLERSVIEIAPLGFMRGRTLSNAFVILDEGQNTTENQMKMFLTRMGQGSKFMITGDITQIDLPNKIPSGLIQALNILDKTKGITKVMLNKTDVIRHSLVETIIEKYAK